MFSVYLPRKLLLTCAQPKAAACYRLADLSGQDRARADRRRGPKADLDWQVSRALLHACRQQALSDRAESLSHCRGHAVLAQGPPTWQLGVDMEMIRPRRVMALAEWACNTAETDWLRGQANDMARLTSFYMLWTLKEAFIKAAGLSFPADLSRYGLDWASAEEHPSLRAPVGRWQARSYLLGSDWVVSVVWLALADENTEVEPQWGAGPSSALPQVTVMGAWR